MTQQLECKGFDTSVIAVECRTWGLFQSLGSQPTGGISHRPGRSLPVPVTLLGNRQSM